MIRIVYSPHQAIAEFTIIIIAFAAVFLLGVVQNIEEYFLRLFTKGLLYAGEASIAMGIAVSVDFQAGILVLLLFRVIAHLFVQEVSYYGKIMPAVSWYLFFKMTVILLSKLNTKQISNPRSKQQRQQYTTSEDKRSLISIFILTISSLILVDFTLPSKDIYHINLIVSIINFTTFLYEVWIMDKSEDEKFRIIANLLPYNLYLYFAQMLLFGKIFYGEYLYFSQKTLIFSVIFFFMLRMIIGSRTQKFNKSDSILFNLTYALGNNKRPKQYLYNKNFSRTLRILDKTSRQFANFIYFLSFFSTISSLSYSYLILSTIIIIYFPIQQQNQRLINYLQKKMNTKLDFKLKLTVPIMALLYLILTKETQSKQQIFDEINNCYASISYQMILCVAMFTSAFLGQYLQQKMKFRIFKLIQMTAPLLLLGWIYWFQCMNTSILMLGVYVMIYCLDTIQQQHRGRVKQGKKD